tara:strand:- start:201 stop:1166 length:966 start_codon:yes stop_codon:yes gene_type:complete
MPKPLISIIIPVFNGQKFLDRCFKTLELQNYNKLDIIFIDNNSTDNTFKMLKEYSKKIYIRIFKCKNRGVSFARNEGLKWAEGEYLSFLDVDDEIHPEKFNILLELFSNYPSVKMAFGLTEKKYIDDNKNYILKLPYHEGLIQPPNCVHSLMKNLNHQPHISSFLVKNKNVAKFPTFLNYGEDVAFLVKLSYKEDIAFTNKVVSIYHRHNESAVSKSNSRQSPSERYLKFYKEFCLDSFFIKKNKNNHKKAFYLSELYTNKILFTLVKIEKNNNYISILNEHNKKYSTSYKIKLRIILFKNFPLKLAFKLFYYLNKIKLIK